VRRVGSVGTIDLDVRVIAATNRNLRQAVNRGTFRADLYFRLNIVRIDIPPLRERRDDIPLLVESFYQLFTGTTDAAPTELAQRLTNQDWPGNVRELRNAVERAVLMQDTELWQEVTSDASVNASYQFDDALTFRAAKERVISQWEHWFVAELIGRHGGNTSRAARAVKMDRTHLRELMHKYHVTAKK
jgi:DNA-binding NtrC family response regulator